MNKSPQGVYVNEADHNTATRLVDNALDGHGNLSGFIDFIEQNLLDAATAVPKEIDSSQEPENLVRRLRVFSQGGFRNDQENTPDNPISSLLARYEQVWEETSQLLPWTQRDSRDHAFAIYFHNRHPRLWAQDDLPGDATPQAFKTIAEALRTLRGETGDRHWVHTIAELSDLGTRIWRGNTLEVLLTEPKSKSTSFYLNPQAHELTLKVFGRDFFGWIERSLLRLLNNPKHWLLKEPELNFLEHGTALLDYQHAYWTKDDAQGLQEEIREFAALFDDIEDEDLTIEIWKPEYQFGGFSFTAAAFDSFSSGQYRLGAFQNSLVLAYRLGLTDLQQEVDLDDLRTRLLPAFLETYGLNRIGPERHLAYRILTTGDIPTLPTYVNNPIDYHIMNLFQQYALSVLPPAERDETRVHPAILATLSQPWVFPTQATLATYSNAKATKTPTGEWHITKGRTTHLTLTDAEAYWTARTLNAIHSTQPIRTMYFTEVHPEEEFLNWDPDHGTGEKTTNPIAWRRALESTAPNTKTINYKLGPDLIQRAKDQIMEAAPVPPAAPISAGILLNAELTDEALKSNGQFAHKLMSYTNHDFSDFTLNPEQLKSLRTILKTYRGHEPAKFHHKKISYAEYAWAYLEEGEEHILGSTYSETVRHIALEHAQAPNADYDSPFTWAIRQENRWDDNDLRQRLIQFAQTPDDERQSYAPRIDDPNFDPEPVIHAVNRYYDVYETAGISRT